MRAAAPQKRCPMEIFRALPSRFARCWSQVARKNPAFEGEHKQAIGVAVLLTFSLLTAIVAVRGQQIPGLSLLPNGMFFPNPGGASQTYSTANGGIDLTGPFFQSLGTNGRSCSSCHQPRDGMSVSAANVERRFVQTQGQDPIFRTVD